MYEKEGFRKYLIDISIDLTVVFLYKRNFLYSDYIATRWTCYPECYVYWSGSRYCGLFQADIDSVYVWI